MNPPTLIPAERFEWERIVRRIPRSHMRPAVKLVALVLATFADADGSRVHPGNPVLCAITGFEDKSVRRILEDLADLGLIERLTRGGGRGPHARAASYRLTIPVDLLERIDLLPPEIVRKTRHALRTEGTGVEPVDNVSTPDRTDRSNGTELPTTADPADPSSKPATLSTPDPGVLDSGSTPDPARLYSGPQGPPTRTKTNHIQTRTPMAGTTVTPPTREGSVDNSQMDSEGVKESSPAPGRCVHGMGMLVRSDGRPSCPFCRRGVDASSDNPPVLTAIPRGATRGVA